MDRRNFLKFGGLTAAGSLSVTPSESFGKVIVSGSGRDRSAIQSSDLTPWTPSSSQPWDVHTINHLYRRAGFGATIAEIAAAVVKTPSQVVDDLLNDALLTQATVPPLPSYADTTNAPPSWLHVPPTVYGNNFLTQMQDYNNATMKIRSHWAVQMNEPGTMLREKLTLFWMNHFVIEAKKVMWPQMTYAFLTYMRTNAWGNFKKMVSDVTILPGMLYYLDGWLNVGKNPNENYARELQELFTMGVTDKNGLPNYTQDDIEAIAHVLTGWTIQFSAPAPNVLPTGYTIANHDSSFKAIYDGISRSYNLKAAENFGVAHSDYDMDLFDHMFDLKVKGNQIAWFICSKLYQYFVYHDTSSSDAQGVIQAMADMFSQNWEIKPVVAALLKSAHFFEEANIGAEIKSPYEHLIGLLRAFDIQIDELAGGTLYYYAAGGSQILLDPPNVKGWPGYHNWISTTTLPYRDTYIETQLTILGSLAALGSDGYSNSDLPVVLSDAMITTWGKQLTNYNGTFDDLLKEIATYLCAQTPSDTALTYIKGKLPPNTYEWSALTDAEKITGLRLMANAIMLLADYQLS